MKTDHKLSKKSLFFEGRIEDDFLQMCTSCYSGLEMFTSTVSRSYLSFTFVYLFVIHFTFC